MREEGPSGTCSGACSSLDQRQDNWAVSTFYSWDPSGNVPWVSSLNSRHGLTEMVFPQHFREATQVSHP